MGDTAVAVNPDDIRYTKFIGKECTVPIINKKVKIIADYYADKDKGSGAVKITPAHDFNDFELGKRHKLQVINIFDKDAKINNSAPIRFRGLDRFTAREKILEELRGINSIVKEEKQKMVVPYGDRSGVIIEPWLTDQWFCDAKKLSIDPIKSIKNNDTKFIPKNWEKTFFNWMDNIQPWCISRQLWWGHQIPAWYGPDKFFFVAESEDLAKKIAFKHYGYKVELIQDEDVLDTWFSSALWTFSTLGWPDKTYELERFYPGSVLVTGFDIIFFWVARMMMMGSHFMKSTPFKDIYIHPLIRDEKGQKMSKSKGNIIDPLILLDKYGADTLRFTLAALLNPGRDVKMSESRVKGYKSFTNKIWNASNFLKLNNCIISKDFKITNLKFPINQWLINELANTNLNIKKYMEKYLFHEVANEIYHFVWHTYCDWYIEFSKSSFAENSEKSIEIKSTAMWAFKEILKLSHPVMPFITEKIWFNLFDKSNFLMNEIYNKYNVNDNYINSQKNFKNLILIISAVRNIRSELNISYKKNIIINIANDNINFINFLRSFESEISRLLKLDKLLFNDLTIKSFSSANLIISDSTIIIPLQGIVDTNKEIQKLNIKKNKELLEFNKINIKLKNPSFIDKAPKKIISQFRDHLDKIKFSIDKIDEIINTIK